MDKHDDETVERVARAIYLAMHASKGGVWDYVETKDVWRGYARAALSALPARDEALEGLRELSERASFPGPLTYGSWEDGISLLFDDNGEPFADVFAGSASGQFAAECVNYVRAKLAAPARGEW